MANRPPLSGNSYSISVLDVCHTSDTQKTVTIELFEGTWPFDQLIKEMFYEPGYCATISTVQAKIKQITMVREKEK